MMASMKPLLTSVALVAALALASANCALFPAVAVGRGALRIILNNHHTLRDVRGIVETIARSLAITARNRS